MGDQNPLASTQDLAASTQTRVASLIEKYEKEDAAAPEPEETAEPADVLAEGEPAPAEQAKPETPAAPAEDERFQAFQKVSRAQAAIRQAEKEVAARKAALDEQEERFKEAMPMLERLLKAKDGDPVALLDLIDEHVPPEKAAEYFMKAGTPRDRDRARLESMIQKERQDRQRLEAEIRGNIQRQQQQAVASQVYRDFLSVREQNKAKFPRVARMPEAFLIQAADAKANELSARGVEWGYLDVLKELEDETSSFLKHFQDEEKPGSTPDEQPTRGRQAAAPIRGSASESSGAGSKKKESREERLRRLRRQYGE